MRGCRAREGCLAGDDGTCLPAPACARLTFPTCASPHVEARRIASSIDRAPGLDGLAARGDILLANDRVRLVLDALDAPHYVAPTGGNILDFTPATGSDDGINVALHAVGILPRDAVAYRSIVLEDHAPDHVAAILRGTLDGRPEITVVTRYELRPCEPGVRVRTELFHGGRDPESFFLCDAFYWGGREAAAFTPTTGRGFVHPSLELEHLGDAFAREPFFAAQSVNESEASYSVVPCDRSEVEAFHSETVTASGAPRTVLLPGDGIAYERFVAVAPGPGLSRATDVAYEARASMFGEKSVVAHGRVVDPAGKPIDGGQRAASILFYEAGTRRPWNAVVPDADGRFVVRLPAGPALRGEISVLGRAVPNGTFDVRAANVDVTLPDVVAPGAGVLDVTVKDGSGAPMLAEIVLTPTDDSGPKRGSTFGAFDVERCSPWLGPPHGASPACNRAIADGATSFAVPDGTYWAYATRGPFATLARARVTIVSGLRAHADFVVDVLDGLVPDGALSADLHVHGGASFDSSMPDLDRVRTFLSEGVEVIAATDHDVVTSYGRALAALGLTKRVVVLPGVETTGHVLFYEPPGQGVIPRVIGHYNFWPLSYDENAPRNGAPWDERLEPGALFDRVAERMTDRGVIQMNHPLASSTFGRDEGFLTAIGYDPRHVIGTAPPPDTPEGQLVKRPLGGRSALDFDAQEVMNGTSMRQFLRYRVGWHSFLSQGILRTGTANSDSHTLSEQVLGVARNVVFGGHTLASFDRSRFDADIRAGHVLGTNGPIVLAEIDGHPPSLTPFKPSPSAELQIEVRAAPWIAVEEIRVLVNGQLARVIGGAAIARPSDPFGKGGIVRYRGGIPLTDLLAGIDDDAWIVIEAGLPLWAALDLDDDGIPETTDNDGNGIIDDRDRDGLEGDDRFREPPRPRETEPRFHAAIFAPGHWSTAFTNPLLIDRRGDGWKAPRR
jgi:hypothetical protein